MEHRSVCCVVVDGLVARLLKDDLHIKSNQVQPMISLYKIYYNSKYKIPKYILADFCLL